MASGRCAGLTSFSFLFSADGSPDQRIDTWEGEDVGTTSTSGNNKVVLTCRSDPEMAMHDKAWPELDTLRYIPSRSFTLAVKNLAVEVSQVAQPAVHVRAFCAWS